MSKLEEANEIIRDLAEEIKKDDGIIEQLRADLDHWKSVVEGVNKTLGATTTTDALMKLAQLRAENAEMRERLEHIAGRADHQIPAYAYGDNEAGCEMAMRLNHIFDDARAGSCEVCGG